MRCCVRLSLWTNMNLDLPQLLWIWKLNDWNTANSSVDISTIPPSLSHLLQFTPTIHNVGLLKDAGLTCQLLNIWKMFENPVTIIIDPMFVLSCHAHLSGSSLLHSAQTCRQPSDTTHSERGKVIVPRQNLHKATWLYKVFVMWPRLPQFLFLLLLWPWLHTG